MTVMVLRYSCGTYLEDQDYWQMSGIQRDVFLLAKPKVHIRDFTLRTSFDAAYRDAALEVEVELSDPFFGRRQPEDFRKFTIAAMAGNEGYLSYSVEFALYDRKGNAVWTSPHSDSFSAHSYMYGELVGTKKGAAKLKIGVENPDQWSAEDPALYTLTMSLVDTIAGTRKAVDFESARFGFRQVEIRNRMVLINGQRMIVRGVDRHEHHPERGRALTVQDMVDDILAMKKLNFNAVRTSHYPDDSRWYDLCDVYGMYVVDEANLETHGVGGDLSLNPEWATMYLDRARRMVIRDKNHPCICFWSLGNESHFGPHHAAMRAWIKQYDPTRPVQYESGNPPSEVSDIMVPMYPSVEWIEKVMYDASEKRPMILCEYAYAKGNATGNLWKYWDLVHTYPSFQGAFVWDWRDKALFKTLPDGRKVYAYGNDLGERFDYDAVGEDATQVLNGIVGPLLEIHPGAFEVKNQQAPVFVEALVLKEGRLRLHNRYSFSDLRHLSVLWNIHADGQTFASGMRASDLAPGATGELILPVADAQGHSGEVFLDVCFTLLEDCPWANKGHEIARFQFQLAASKPRAVRAARASGLPTIETKAGETWWGHPSGYAYLFDGKTGNLTGISGRGGEAIMSQPLSENFFRAPLENDWILGHDFSYSRDWERLGIDCLKVESANASASQVDGELHIRSRKIIGNSKGTFSSAWDSFTCVGEDGRISFSHAVIIDGDVQTIPRIGMRMALAGDCRNLSWYGRGPWENYPDRKSSALVGRYSLDVLEEEYPYIVPGEYGARQDVREFSLLDTAGQGILVSGERRFSFSAHQYSQEELAKKDHYWELRADGLVHVSIDCFLMGLGGDDGWTRNVHPEFHIGPGSYRWGFTMEYAWRWRGVAGGLHAEKQAETGRPPPCARLS